MPSNVRNNYTKTSNTVFRYEDDSDDSTSEVRKRRRDGAGDKDKDPSKSKKKHKKHKKNKKSSKHDNDSKERSGSGKKHKKHRKRHKSDNESNSDSDMPAKHDDAKSAKIEREVIVKALPVARSTESDVLAKSAISTLNTKFTQIMKSNGHIVVPKTLTTKNGNEASARHTTTAVAAATIKIPTDPSKLVELITQSLDSTVPSMQIVSSESESDSVQDVDSPDVAVIEDDELNLEELMKQKALLQARLGNYAMSDTEGEATPALKTPAVVELAKAPIIRTNGNFEFNHDFCSSISTLCEFLAAKRPAPIPTPAATNNDVILLDDSSNDATVAKQSPPKKQRRSSRSRSRERIAKAPVKSDRERVSGAGGGGGRENDRRNRRSDNDNRFKEDLRQEIDRDKERNNRDQHQPRGMGNSANRYDDRQRDGRYGRNRYSMERERDGRRMNDMRYNDRQRNYRDDRQRGNAEQSRKRREEKNDKFMGSLSEGQKPDRESNSSSGSDIGDIKLDDEDEEEKIIEMRRKNREELLKKLAVTSKDSSPVKKSVERFSDESNDVIFVETPPKKQQQPTSFKNVINKSQNRHSDQDDAITPPLPEKTKPDDAKPDENPKPNVAPAPKRNDWDMFAEQDIDSNFDVSHSILVRTMRCSSLKLNFRILPTP